MFSLHGKIALITLAFLALAAIGKILPLAKETGTPPVPLDIGIEHTLPLSLALTLTEGTKQSLIDIDQTSGGTVYITVPRIWKRTEVRGSAISAFTSEDTAELLRRWTLPANAGISFSSDETPANMRLHNPSGVPVKVQLTRVNLKKETSTYDVYLLKDGFLPLP